MRNTFNILFYVKFEDDNLAFVRDIFAFVCFTALSFIDVKNLTTDNIVDINGDKWIISKQTSIFVWHFTTKCVLATPFYGT